ncbi:MAG: NAD-binding protein [Kiritimatiellae bacterium]|nr:NAD-binding protein [Kiritimatiellia bacterium]
MKIFPSLLLVPFCQRVGTRNVITLLRFLGILLLLIVLYCVLFHLLMAGEGQTHSWITGLYWTLTVMSTLGFGDITFHSDLGRIFSIIVLLSGMLFMLTLLPFTVIQFFYAPWMATQLDLRIPRSLPEESQGHVILIHDDEVTRTLIRKLRQFHYDYVMLTPSMQTAQSLKDEGIHTMVGELDDPQTYRNCRIEQAGLIAVTASDVVNTSVASTVRGLCEDIPILATVQHRDSVDILELSGCNRVLHLGEMMGAALARRCVAGDAMAHVVATFNELQVAEAVTANTPLVGKTLRESRLRELLSINVVGLWERGVFQAARPDAVIHQSTVLVLAGSEQQLHEYDELFCIYTHSSAPVLIIGGGRVGRATGKSLAERGIDYRIVEKLPERILDDGHYVEGSAADFETLKRAGIMDCPTVIITTHEDDLNVYLAIYCRKLRPDVQIIARATAERIVGALHRSGADLVMSYASMGANAIFNLLKRSDVQMIAEGLDIFKLEIPRTLIGKTMAELGMREATGCTVLAVSSADGMQINPSPTLPFPAEGEIVVIGSAEAEEVFLAKYSTRR